MTGHAAYKKMQHLSTTRIDLILTLYRKAFENLDRARQALTQAQPDLARPFLLNTQQMVASMAAELPAYKDESAVNFLRLYEFVAHQMMLGTVESIDAAVKVLTPLREGFEAVRDQAVSLEMQGAIPPLDQARLVSVTA
jgi:flagellar secretion chaperone FliS